MPRQNSKADDRRSVEQIRPRWDPVRRELWLGNRLVKRFRVPAGNQELILTAFEEQDWSVHIDDPLPRAALVDPCERLHAAIKRLNGCQRAPLLRFSADGRGKGIFWEPLR